MSFMGNMPCEWEDFDEEAQTVDNGNLEEMLRLQLSELEMLESMFSNPGEFSMDDYSVVADINDFLETKCVYYPPRLDFTINLVIEKTKLEVCVNLPHDYPASEPDIFVRSNHLNRDQQHNLNSDLANFITSLDRGEICICSAVSWLQENACHYETESEPTPPPRKCEEEENLFTRYWIYSHHIYSKVKRREMLDLAKEFNITGFCLPGRPGIICAEGLSWNCNEWWHKVKCMNWKKIICKKKEVMQGNIGGDVDLLRKFPPFQEISFDCSKPKSRDRHTDMGELYRYLTQHDCGYVFKDYFGVDGKLGQQSA